MLVGRLKFVISRTGLNECTFTFEFEAIYERVVFSTDVSRPPPIVGPFLFAKLISTNPLILYFAAGELTFNAIKLFLGELPKENPLAGRRPLAVRAL